MGDGKQSVRRVRFLDDDCVTRRQDAAALSIPPPPSESCAIPVPVSPQPQAFDDLGHRYDPRILDLALGPASFGPGGGCGCSVDSAALFTFENFVLSDTGASPDNACAF